MDNSEQSNESSDIPNILERLKCNLLEKYKSIDSLKLLVQEKIASLEFKKKSLVDKAKAAYEQCSLAKQQLQSADTEVNICLYSVLT